mgnify:CR=1 FL=1
MYKWLFAFFGYTIFRLPGALIGFFIGSFLSPRSVKISNRDFEINLLALASLVIKADGKVSQKELDFVRRYFVSAYGKNRANEVFKIFNQNFKNKGISVNQISKLFNLGLNYESKLQVIHFLFGIAKADGSISQQEINKLLDLIKGQYEQSSRHYHTISHPFHVLPEDVKSVIKNIQNDINSGKQESELVIDDYLNNIFNSEKDINKALLIIGLWTNLRFIHLLYS